MAAVVFDSTVFDGADMGVRSSSDPAGALGTWTDGESPAICIPDGTRHLDSVSALEALTGRVPNHGPIIVGLGLHRRMTETELLPWSKFNVVQHDPDDVVATEEIDGIPGFVNRHVAKAPYAIAVGVVELHQYAGVSGGHKAVAVGCGGRKTIAALHHRDQVVRPGVEIGRLHGNPFRDAVDRLGEAAGCQLALVYVPAVERWLFGRPKAVVTEALRQMQPWTWVSERADGAILDVPSSKATSFYQASRAASYLALSPQPPLKDNALLVIRARCAEGLGAEQGFRDALARCRPPWSELLGCVDPAVFEAVGVDASTEQRQYPATWLRVRDPFQRLPQYGSPPESDED